jgi:hypothetical protein
MLWTNNKGGSPLPSPEGSALYRLRRPAGESMSRLKADKECGSGGESEKDGVTPNANGNWPWVQFARA